MKKHTLLLSILGFILINKSVAQTFPDCYAPYQAKTYKTGDKASLNNVNYTAKYWVDSPPPGGAWKKDGNCGNADDVIGTKYSGEKKIIGYMPTWQKKYNFNNYDPSKLTHVIVSFLEFKPIDKGIIHANMDYNSNDFVSSIAFSKKSVRQVDSILNHSTTKLLQKSKATNTKVMVAVGGAIDYGFLWLMNKYYDDDAKINEIAQLIINYINDKGIDGVDLDMECWWADSTINKNTDQGGRKRGDKWGGSDDGPENASVGITRLAKKIKELSPNTIVSTVVFGTGWYGNNYDENMAKYLDWIGVFTYDLTGSWDKTPFGPHSSIKKLPLNKYPNQNENTPIYSVEDIYEYWTGLATPTWNHDGGFNIERNKLCIGSPFYGYDFSTHKPNGGNGYEFEKYVDIVAKYPNAPTSYDSQTPGEYNGNVKEGGENIFYETPKRAKAKVDYLYDKGLQGLIIWELTNDLPSDNKNSLLKSIYDQKQQRMSPLSTENIKIVENNDLRVNYSNGKIKYWYSKIDQNSTNKTITVYNILGKKITSFKADAINGEHTIFLSKGIYLIKDNFNQAKKIISL